MKQGMFIGGPLPGLNEIIAAAKGCRGRGIMYSRMKADQDSAIRLQIRANGLKPMAAANFTFLWREKSKRRDPDNVAAARKFILDALVAEGILPNDGWAEILGWQDRFEVANPPGVIVELDGPVA